MTPNYSRVESLAADGRIYIAVGVFALLGLLIGLAWWLGRAERLDRARRP